MKESSLYMIQYQVFMVLLLLVIACNSEGLKQDEATIFQARTYCNPLDIDYTYSVVSTHRGLSYRSGADPCVVRHNGEFYLFVTRSHGYWHSKDMRTWEFIRPARWYFESSNAPGAWSADSVLLMLGNPIGWMSLITASDPYQGNWQPQPSLVNIELHDPALFVDDDGKTYVYEGSSNVYPILGAELDPNNYYLPVEKPKELLLLHPEEHGWERFGENHISDIDPFVEGPWMTKHNGKYYLQYGAPGTQWNVYADGVYVGEHPLGPFEYAPYNPVSYKPGGYARGAGHGSTVRDNQGNYWHFGTMRVSVNYLFERRIGMFPAGFEENGQMYANTAYGDYPHYLPEEEVESHKNRFTGWMLLSYKKPVSASSVKALGEMKRLDESAGGWMLPLENINHNPQNVTDEDIRSFWIAETNGEAEWLQIDLEETANVHAVQINYQDYNSNIFGKPDTLYHQFVIDYSEDGEEWHVAADYSQSRKDQPNAYIELEKSVSARYVRFKNIHVPTPNLGLSGFRIFGKGNGAVPSRPDNFEAKGETDRRNAQLSWSAVENAQGYTLYWGIEKDKLNNSVMVYEENVYDLRALNVEQGYYFAVEAFNENGISEKAFIQHVL